MNLDFKTGIKLFVEACEKIQEQKAWDMWLMLYPNMDKKNFIPFSKFYKKTTTPDKPNKHLTKEEIIAQAENIKQIHQLAK